MNIWLKEFGELVGLLLGKPESALEYAVFALVVIIVLLLAGYVVGRATRITNLGVFRRILAFTLGIFCLMAVWIATQRHLLPFVETGWLRLTVSIGVPLLAGLVIVIPIQQAIYHSAYVPTLITFVVSLALAVLFVILTHAVLDAVHGGEAESRIIKHRTKSVDDIIGN